MVTPKGCHDRCCVTPNTRGCSRGRSCVRRAEPSLAATVRFTRRCHPAVRRPTRRPDDWLADPVEWVGIELTEDCRASRNARHLPHSLLRPSLPFSRSNRHGVKTLVCRARCSLGEPEVPSACPSRWPIGLRMGRIATLPAFPECFNPVSASFSDDVGETSAGPETPSEATGGTLAATTVGPTRTPAVGG